MKLVLPPDFPHSPPKGFFTTKIWHPNVSKAGEICVNVLKRDWQPTLGLRHVLMVIRCLLIEPYPESALNEEAGKALLEEYSGRMGAVFGQVVYSVLQLGLGLGWVQGTTGQMPRAD